MQHAAKDLFLAFHCGHDHFTAQLYKLIAKADPSNRAKLMFAFPVEVACFMAWQATPVEKDFFATEDIGAVLLHAEKKLYESGAW
jgi:hypothetical protein